MKPTTTDRRESDRVSTALPLNIGGCGDKNGAILRNLSLSGLSCFSRTALEVGSNIEIKMTLPALPEEESPDYSLEAMGIVVRCEPISRPTSLHHYEIAIYFAEITDRNTETLTNFLDVRGRQSDR